MFRLSMPGHYHLGKRLKAFLACRSGTRAALGLEGRVDIFHGSHRVGLVQTAGELVGHSLCVCDGLAHKFLAGVEGAHCSEGALDCAHIDFGERAGTVFAVAAYEWHRGAVVEQLNHSPDTIFG